MYTLIIFLQKSRDFSAVHT